MSNRDDGWQWLLLGAAIAAFDYWRRYTMYADTVRPYGTAGGFNIFVEQYHSIKRSNPRLAPKAAAWCLAGGIILGAFAIGTHVGGVGVIAYVLLALALLLSRHHRPTQAQMEPVWAWHKANRQGSRPRIPAWQGKPFLSVSWRP